MTIRDYIENVPLNEYIWNQKQAALQRASQEDPMDTIQGTLEGLGRVAYQVTYTQKRAINLKARAQASAQQYKQTFSDNYVSTNLAEVSDVLFFIYESLMAAMMKRIEGIQNDIGRGAFVDPVDKDFVSDAMLRVGETLAHTRTTETDSGFNPSRGAETYALHTQSHLNPNKFDTYFTNLMIEYIKEGSIHIPERPETKEQVYYHYLKEEFQKIEKTNYARIAKLIPAFKGLGLSDAHIIHFGKHKNLQNIKDIDFIARRVYNTASDNPELVAAMKSAPGYELLKLQDRVAVLDDMTENISAAGNILSNIFGLITIFRRVLNAKKLRDKASIKSAKQILDELYLKKIETEDSLKAMEKKLLEVTNHEATVMESISSSFKSFFNTIKKRFSKIRKDLLDLTVRIRKLN